MLIACNFGYIKIIFILLIEVIIFYMQTFIVIVKILGLKNFFLGNGVCLAMFLAVISSIQLILPKKEILFHFRLRARWQVGRLCIFLNLKLSIYLNSSYYNRFSVFAL